VGEHSVEVLREAGFSADEVARMCAEGAVVDGRMPAADCDPNPA
jgi:hypothetical protein